MPSAVDCQVAWNGTAASQILVLYCLPHWIADAPFRPRPSISLLVLVIPKFPTHPARPVILLESWKNSFHIL